MAELRPCAAGRTAFFGGRWKRPCTNNDDLRHVIAAPGLATPIELCEEHFQQVLGAGLVSEPYMDPGEYKRRRRGDLN